jgi:hypothetical protein
VVFIFSLMQGFRSNHMSNLYSERWNWHFPQRALCSSAEFGEIVLRKDPSALRQRYALSKTNRNP